jgi:3-hydroxyanthranilate 3,4-dioxygenase
MYTKTAFNFQQWIDEHRDVLKPPVCNKLVFPDAEFIVMVVGGPNSRTDYHYDEGEEFFYQLEGEMVLRTMQDGQRVDIPIKAGEIYLLPARVPHSPQRMADSVGLVIERQRLPGEKDGLMWFCDACDHKLYEEYFVLQNIEEDLPPVFERYYGSEANRTCETCGAVAAAPERDSG